MNIKIAVCDDTPLDIKHLVAIIEEYAATHQEHYHITLSTFSNGDSLIEILEKGESFDIIFLDIMMPYVNGIEVAKEIRLNDSVSKIIFLTSSSEFAVESYSVNAFHYLLKPVQATLLKEVLDNALLQATSSQKESLLVYSKKALMKIYVDDIEYIEVKGHILYFHLRNNKILESYGVMTKLEKALLAYPSFIKPHRSYIINMNYISLLTPTQVKTHSYAPIPISRINYPGLKQAYMDYLFTKDTPPTTIE